MEQDLSRILDAARTSTLASWRVRLSYSWRVGPTDDSTDRQLTVTPDRLQVPQ
jgi:hypothetical protein